MNNQKKLESDFNFFLEKKNDFMQDSELYGKFIAIENKKIIGSSFDRDELLKKMMKQGHRLGNFIIQHVIEGNNTVQRFFSRVRG